MNNYPAGVSDATIDEHFGGHWPCQECNGTEDTCVCMETEEFTKLVDKVNVFLVNLLKDNTRIGPKIRNQIIKDTVDGFHDIFGDGLTQAIKDNE